MLGFPDQVPIWLKFPAQIRSSRSLFLGRREGLTAVAREPGARCPGSVIQDQLGAPQRRSAKAYSASMFPATHQRFDKQLHIGPIPRLGVHRNDDPLATILEFELPKIIQGSPMRTLDLIGKGYGTGYAMDIGILMPARPRNVAGDRRIEWHHADGREGDSNAMTCI